MTPPKSIVALAGSVQPGSYTLRALRLVIDDLEARYGLSVDLLDPARLSLPFPGQPATPDVARVQNAVRAARGAILATPEYHGSYSSVLKQLIDNLGHPSPLAGKPVALLGVAHGAIGAVKSLEHLRSVCAHLGAVVLPKAVSIAGADQAFDDAGHCTNEEVAARLHNLAAALAEFLGAPASADI
jgi:FMN reductase